MGQAVIDGEPELEFEPVLANRPKRILIVDDFGDTAALLARHLNRLGYEACSVHSAEAALEVCGLADFDLLISDIHLPGKSGLELLRELQASQPIRGIAMTGYRLRHSPSMSLAAGYDVHLNKPIDIDLLMSAIRGLLQ